MSMLLLFPSSGPTTNAGSRSYLMWFYGGFSAFAAVTSKKFYFNRYIISRGIG